MSRVTLPFLLLFAVSGAAALIYEVIWTRLLTLYLGHGLAAASAVLAAFMGGLAAGAGAAGRVAGKLDRTRALRTYAAPASSCQKTLMPGHSSYAKGHVP